MKENFINIKINKLLDLLNNEILKGKDLNDFINLGEIKYENSFYENGNIQLKSYTEYDSDNLKVYYYFNSKEFIIIYNDLNKLDYVINIHESIGNNINIYMYYNKNIKDLMDFYENEYFIRYNLFKNQILYLFYKIKFKKNIISKKIEYEKIDNYFKLKKIAAGIFTKELSSFTILYDIYYSDRKNYFNLNECKSIFDLYCNEFKVYQLYNNKKISKKELDNKIDKFDSLYLINKLVEV